MSVATIWFGWQLCSINGACFSMKDFQTCKKAEFLQSWCINNETGKRK